MAMAGTRYSRWITGQRLAPLSAMPHSYFAAVSRSDRKRSLKEVLEHNWWARDIVGMPTTQVLCQYLHVWAVARDVTLNPL